MSSIPKCFTSCCGFNDSRKKRHVVRFDCKTLENLTSNLFQVLSLHVYWNEKWCRFQSDLEKHSKTLKFYTDDLEKENESQQLRQSRLNPASQPFNVIDLEAVCVAPLTYQDIDDVVSHSSEYEVIHAVNLLQLTKVGTTFSSRTFNSQDLCICIDTTNLGHWGR